MPQLLTSGIDVTKQDVFMKRHAPPGSSEVTGSKSKGDQRQLMSSKGVWPKEYAYKI